MKAPTYTKDTPETRAKVLELLRQGHCLELASTGAGITSQTLRNWRKADPEFSEQVEIADGQGLLDIEAELKAMAKDRDLGAIKLIIERRKATRGAYAPPVHNPAVAIQNNYFNPLGQIAPVRDLIDVDAQDVQILPSPEAG